jgi:hypothetical protein
MGHGQTAVLAAVAGPLAHGRGGFSHGRSPIERFS